jgi:hypothetical protein
VSGLENEGKITPASVALLIQAIFWVGIALCIQIALGIPIVTLSMVFIGISELVFRYLCLRLATSQGGAIDGVQQIFSDEYLRHVEPYSRVLLYVAVQALIFLAGIAATLLSTFSNNDSLVLFGALLCITSFLKLVPVYPLEGGILFLKSFARVSPATRIMFESLGYLIMGIVVGYLVSMSIAAFFLVPALILPLRVQSLLTRYSLILRCEDYVREQRDEPPSDQDLLMQVRSSPELRGMEEVYNEEEREFFIESIVRDVCLRPFHEYQQDIIRRIYTALLLLQVVVLFSFLGYYFGVGKEAVQRPLAVSDCKIAGQRLNSYRNLLEITGDFKVLRDAVVTCRLNHGDFRGGDRVSSPANL